VFVYFLGVLVRACPILRFRVLFVFFWFLGVCPVLVVLVMSLGSYSVSLSYSWPCRYFLSSFLGKKSGDELWIILATRLIKARARQEGRASLYDWIVYKRGSKAKERKGEERKHRSKLYTIIWSRDGKLRQVAAICQYRFPLAP